MHVEHILRKKFNQADLFWFRLNSQSCDRKHEGLIITQTFHSQHRVSHGYAKKISEFSPLSNTSEIDTNIQYYT